MIEPLGTWPPSTGAQPSMWGLAAMTPAHWTPSDYEQVSNVKAITIRSLVYFIIKRIDRFQGFHVCMYHNFPAVFVSRWLRSIPVHDESWLLPQSHRHSYCRSRTRPVWSTVSTRSGQGKHNLCDTIFTNISFKCNYISLSTVSYLWHWCACSLGIILTIT